jgi:hypothetical protein
MPRRASGTILSAATPQGQNCGVSLSLTIIAEGQSSSARGVGLMKATAFQVWLERVAVGSKLGRLVVSVTGQILNAVLDGRDERR